MSDIFDAAGALREAYERVDWGATPLGPVGAWSPTLVATVDFALQTRFPVTLMWGPDFTLVYNEAYVTMIADKHPRALGSPAREVFPEIWDTIGPMLSSVAAGDPATWVQDLRLHMDRHGYVEETYFTFSYSGVRGLDGRVEGVIDIATETTNAIITRRRLLLLARLNDRLSDLDDLRQLVDRALPVLRGAQDDLPAVDLRIPGETLVEPEPSIPAASLADLKGRDLALVESDGGRLAMVRLPTASTVAEDAMLIVRLSPHLAADDAYLGYIRLIGARLTQALSRIHFRQAERRTASLEREMSETLQRSLLAPPVQPPHLQLAVRYHTASEHAQVGGDWYDSFLLPDGTLTVAVGDVTGHDRNAAAAMAQLRNLLRGIAHSLGDRTPARVVSSLDEAIADLAVNAVATLVLAQVADEPDGSQTLRWTNAGHPPPALLSADGTVRLLHTAPEILLGTRVRRERSDHVLTLEPGASVVFYTDGLVERRGEVIDRGFERLVRALEGQQALTADQLCGHLLDAFADATEDDVVLTVVQARS